MQLESIKMYKSEAQRRFFHTDTAKKAGITSSQVKEFDSTSKGMKLPEYKKAKRFSKVKGYLNEKNS